MKTHRQRGTALIEFALVLPLLLALLVGTIYYGYVLMLESAVTHAAQQAAVAAVAVPPVGASQEDYNAAVDAAISQSVDNSLDWLPASIRDGATSSGVLSGTLLQVTVTLAVTGNSSPLLPQIQIPGIGPFPPVPAQLQAVAKVTL